VSTKTPGNHRTRRTLHLSFAAALRERKRLRRLRREIHEAMDQARVMVAESGAPRIIEGPFRAPDVRVAGLGWQILGPGDELIAYASSRDKARARTKAANDGSEPIKTTGYPITQDEAMLRLGWRRKGTGRGGVEDRYERATR
jgi:hypothetical protein